MPVTVPHVCAFVCTWNRVGEGSVTQRGSLITTRAWVLVADYVVKHGASEYSRHLNGEGKCPLLHCYYEALCIKIFEEKERFTLYFTSRMKLSQAVVKKLALSTEECREIVVGCGSLPEVYIKLNHKKKLLN